MEDDELSGRPRTVVNEENAKIVREFLRKEPKSSLKYMESELGISAKSIYRILTENRIVTINHSPYSTDMAPCDFYFILQ